MRQDRNMPRFLSCLIIATGLFYGSFAAANTSQVYDDDAAPKFPMTFYDMNVTQPETMRDFLSVINATYDLMIDKGVPVRRIKFVVSLRGFSVKIASDPYLDGLEDTVLAEAIRTQLDGLKSRGIRIEACLISCNWMGVPVEDMVDGIVIIDNAFAASTFYQRKGYALVPIHQLP